MLFGRHFAGHAWDIAVDAGPARLTLAGVGCPLLPARPSVLTGGRVAPAHKVLERAKQICNFISIICLPDVIKLNIITFESLCDVDQYDPMSLSYLAVDPCVSMLTGALVRPVAVLAGASVDAGFGVALVDVVLAVAPGEARQTQAGEGVDAVHTGAAVEAGAGGTIQMI